MSMLCVYRTQMHSTMCRHLNILFIISINHEIVGKTDRIRRKEKKVFTSNNDSCRNTLYTVRLKGEWVVKNDVLWVLIKTHIYIPTSITIFLFLFTPIYNELKNIKPFHILNYIPVKSRELFFFYFLIEVYSKCLKGRRGHNLFGPLRGFHKKN